MTQNPEVLPSVVELFLRVMVSCVKRKGLFLSIVLIPLAITVFLLWVVIEPTFAGRAVFTPPTSSSKLNLNSLMGDQAGFSSLLGFGNLSIGDEINLVWTLIGSKDIQDQIVKKFDLAKHYKFDGPFYSDLLKEFRSNLKVELNDEDMFVLTIEDKDYKKAAAMTTEMVGLVDSAYTAIKSRQAKESMTFFESRLSEAEDELEKLENSYVEFQKKSGLISPSTQMDASIEILTGLFMEQTSLDLDYQTEVRSRGLATEKAKMLHSRLNDLNSKIEGVRMGGPKKSGLPLVNMGNFSQGVLELERLERELLIKGALVRVLRQKYEELRLEESKSLKQLVILEQVWENNKKVAPPRVAFLILVVGVFGCLAILVCLTLDALNRDKELDGGSYRAWNDLRSVFKA